MKTITRTRWLALAFFIILLMLGKNILWLAVLVLSLLFTPLFGRFYCGYLCPMNTTMRLLKTKKAIRSVRFDRFLPWFTLLGSVFIMVLLRKVLHIDFPILVFWWVLAILITLMLHPSFFHNVLCPFSGPLRLLGQFTQKGVRVCAEQCISCGKCVPVCPSQAITQAAKQAAVIDASLCHQCRDCMHVCPTDAIQILKKPSASTGMLP